MPICPTVQPPGGVVWSPFSNLWLYDQTTDVLAARAHGVLVCIGSDWGPSGSKNLLGELKVAHTWVRHAGLDVTPFDLAEMVTSNPGDLLARAWSGLAPGRLQPGRMADAVVIAKRYEDPWTNLVLARERDIVLVVGDGRARYGTAALMKAAGETCDHEHAGRRRRSRRFALRRPDDPTKTWTWTAVMSELRTVQADPVAAIEQGLAVEAFEADVTTTASTGTLILESDMPGGPNSVAGPPPPGTQFDAPPLPSLVHDAAWFAAVRERRLPQPRARQPRSALRGRRGPAVNDALAGLSWAEAVAAAPPRDPLTQAERTNIITMFTNLLDGLYVHLPLKRAMYGIDPVQQLRRLHERARLMSDDAFHREIGGILTNLRDAHTAYIAPSALAGTAARLPFLVEQFGADRRTSLHGVQDHPRTRQRPEVRRRCRAHRMERSADRRRRSSSRRERAWRPARQRDGQGIRLADVSSARNRPATRRALDHRRLPRQRRRPDSRTSFRLAIHLSGPTARCRPPHCAGRRGQRDPPRSGTRAPRQETVVQLRTVADRTTGSRRRRASASPTTDGSPDSSRTTSRPAW